MIGKSLRDDFSDLSNESLLGEDGLRVHADSELKLVNAPYLGEKEADKPKYTLVLDLDETLIHF